MKKLIALSILSVTLLCGCTPVASNGFFGSDTAEQSEVINSDFTKIKGEKHLYYNNDTKVVYWIGGSYQLNVAGEDFTTSYISAYYAPNGLPYMYDTNTKELVEIKLGGE